MMQSALRKVGPSPYSLSVMAGILLVTVTAYPQSLDQSTAFKEKKRWLRRNTCSRSRKTQAHRTNSKSALQQFGIG
jgi:hypothetical protein